MPDMNTVMLSDEHLENVRREMMKAASESLTIAADELRDLAEVSPWSDETKVSDVIGAVRIAVADLESVEALGWPENDRGDSMSPVGDGAR